MIDMHIHTKNSDGEFTTEEIVKMIQKNNITTFSITDHDNIKSCEEVEKIKIPKTITYIPGVEFSSKTDKYNCHILGYDINYNNEQIINECNIIRKRKIDKLKKLIKLIKEEYGIYITQEEEKEIFKKQGTIGRIDLCRLLIIKGYGTRREIYDKYLSNLKDIETHRSNIETITNIIKKSNGISILAHPKKIEKEYNVDIENIIEEFIERGINGIEAYNSVHNLKDVKRYLLLAKKYNLLITGGSDFHGIINHPERILGYTTKEKIRINSSNIKLH